VARRRARRERKLGAHEPRDQSAHRVTTSRSPRHPGDIARPGPFAGAFLGSRPSRNGEMAKWRNGGMAGSVRVRVWDRRTPGEGRSGPINGWVWSFQPSDGAVGTFSRCTFRFSVHSRALQGTETHRETRSAPRNATWGRGVSARVRSQPAADTPGRSGWRGRLSRPRPGRWARSASSAGRTRPSWR
jgi:hypothetical protein